MRTPERNKPRLKARVEALSDELARMESEIRDLSRATVHPDREAAARRLRRFGEEQARPKAGPVSGRASMPEIPTRVAAEKHAVERDIPPLQGGAAADAESFPKGGPDPRFANYFVTGGLHSVQPLRQERRVQRNKAIFMLILAGILLYAVISQLF